MYTASLRQLVPYANLTFSADPKYFYFITYPKNIGSLKKIKKFYFQLSKFYLFELYNIKRCRMSYSKKDYFRYLNGDLSQKEAVAFLKWIESKEGERKFKSWVDDAWNEEFALSKPETPVKPINPAPVQSSSTQRKKIKKWPLWAASISFFLIVSFVLVINMESDLPEEYKTEIEITEITKSAPKGVKTKIKLPDGSIIYLNSESSITYLTDFSDKRTVRLEGEAFFEVETNPANPFTVITGPISTVAMGTSFNINAYEEAEDIQVSLASGKIKVSNDIIGKEMLVAPGEVVEFEKESEEMTKGIADVSKMLLWKDGIIHFERVPFKEVVNTLERWYGVEIEVKGRKQLPMEKCSGEFGPNEYLSNVLNVLSHTIEFEYSIANKKVTLEFK
jgi:transmembrane sensor